MIEKFVLDFMRKNKKKENLLMAKSLSSSKKQSKNNIIYSVLKIKEKRISKNLHQRNILFNNKLSTMNPNSTSTSSLSSSTEKKYLTPTKYNKDSSNDYYFNESFNNKQDIFQNVNISRPKLDYDNNLKKNKNMHLTLGTGLNRYNNNYFSGNEYGTNKVLLVNKSFKFQKNKLVLCRKVDISHNNSRNNEDEKDISSKSEENFKIHKRTNNNSDILGENKLGKNINEYDRQNNRYSNLEEKLKEEKRNGNDNNIDIIANSTKKKKFKNIVLRPHKMQKENELKYNIKVNKYIKDESPELIKKIMQKFNIKPKYSRVFKYK